MDSALRRSGLRAAVQLQTHSTTTSYTTMMKRRSEQKLSAITPTTNIDFQQKLLLSHTKSFPPTIIDINRQRKVQYSDLHNTRKITKVEQPSYQPARKNGGVHQDTAWKGHNYSRPTASSMSKDRSISNKENARPIFEDLRQIRPEVTRRLPAPAVNHTAMKRIQEKLIQKQTTKPWMNQTATNMKITSPPRVQRYAKKIVFESERAIMQFDCFRDEEVYPFSITRFCGNNIDVTEDNDKQTDSEQLKTSVTTLFHSLCVALCEEKLHTKNSSLATEQDATSDNPEPNTFDNSIDTPTYSQQQQSDILSQENQESYAPMKQEESNDE